MKKRKCIYKKFIGILLALVMLVSGIHVTKAQSDSFFACAKGSWQGVSIESIQKKIEPMCRRGISCSKCYEGLQEKTKQQKYQKNRKEDDVISPDAVLHTNLFYGFQKADIRLWRPTQLTDAVIIHFIHQQDGSKRSA